MSKGTFSETLIQLKALKRIFACRPKIDFFQGVSPCFLAKNDHTFKSVLFTHLGL